MGGEMSVEEIGDPLLASWHSYPSIFALGHRALKELFLDPVTVEEKVDGSQFSFGLFRDGYRCRSKGAQLNLIAPQQMFAKGVEMVQGLPLRPGWTYRGEYLAKPKHNALAYDRIPDNHVILFDINTGHESYLSPQEKREEAARLGLEVVPDLSESPTGQTMITDPATFRALLAKKSCLGGQLIEGIVVKNYARFGQDKKVLLGKFVSESFKEVHAAAWKESNPGQKDILNRLIESYKTPARWAKAVQHLRDDGKLEGTPRDIGAIMKEVWPDIEKECKEDIKDSLYQWAQGHLRRGITSGIPEWYKDQLLVSQFEVEK